MAFSKWCPILSIVELRFTCVTNTAEHIANTHFKKPSVVFFLTLGFGELGIFREAGFQA